MSKHDQHKIAKGTVAPVATAEEMGFDVTSIGRARKKVAHRPPLRVHVEQIIRQRAYELYEQRGREDGRSQEDWLRAEAEVLGTVFRTGTHG